MYCKGCTRQMRRMRKMRKGLPGKQYYNGKQGEHMKTKKKHWYDYLWIWSIAYFALGFFNILFAWLGMVDFLLPLILAAFDGNKFFCNHLCGRGQLYCKLGGDLKCSRNKPTPKWTASKWFRYGFLIFFLAMFGNMVFQTYLVASGSENLREAIKLFWTFRIPWG